VRAAYALGVNAYVRKPLTFDALIATVRQLFTFWATVNILPPVEGAP
jgi:DNA-binding NarL/FixJ family response regulator